MRPLESIDVTSIMYILVLSVAVWLGYMVDRTNKKMYVGAVITVLTFVAGFRGVNCGVDTPSYYDNIVQGFPYPWMFREFGFRTVANFFTNECGNPQLVFIFCAFVTNFLILLRIYDFCKDAKFGFMTLLYILLYYSNSMNIMRQYVAVALVFYGSRFLKKNIVLFILFMILAVTFHRSSLLAIGYLGIVLWNGFSKSQKVVFSIPMLFISIVIVGYVRTYLANDINSYASQLTSNVNITYFYLLIITLLVLTLRKLNVGIKLTSYICPLERANNKIDIDIVLYVLIGLAFSALSMFFEFVGRTGLYYSIYEVVFWGIACKKFQNAKFNKLLIMVYAIYVFTISIVRNDIGLFPYMIFFY